MPTRLPLKINRATPSQDGRQAASSPAVSDSRVLANVESKAEFEELRKSCMERFAPADLVELAVVDRIVTAEWRLRRIRRIEKSILAGSLLHVLVQEACGLLWRGKELNSLELDSRMLTKAHRDSDPQLQRLRRSEAECDRSVERALRLLERLRKSAYLQATHPPEPPAAAAEEAAKTPRLAAVRPIRPEPPATGIRIPASTTFGNG